MESPCTRFTPAEGGARLAASAGYRNVLVTEHAAFISTSVLVERAHQIRGPLSSGRHRSVFVTRSSRVKCVAHELTILTDIAVAQAHVHGDVEDWRLELETKELLVCTSEVLQQILKEQILTIPNINVLIIDSCHLIFKDPNLQYIMKVYKECKNEKPTILALTYPLFTAPKDINDPTDNVDSKPSENKNNDCGEVTAAVCEESKSRCEEKGTKEEKETECKEKESKETVKQTHDKDVKDKSTDVNDLDDNLIENQCTKDQVDNDRKQESSSKDVEGKVDKNKSEKVENVVSDMGCYDNMDDFNLYEKLEWKIEELERELCCEMDLAEDIDGGKRLSATLTKPKEVIIEYNPKLPSDLLPEPYIQLEHYMKCTVKDALNFINEHRYDPTEIYGEDMYEEFANIPDPTVEPKSILTDFLYVLDELGPYAADKAAFSLLMKLESLKIKVPYERHFLLLCVCTSVFIKIRGYADMLFSTFETDWEKITMFSTPKILRLAEILEQFKPDCKDDNSKNKNVENFVNKLIHNDNTKLDEVNDISEMNENAIEYLKTRENIVNKDNDNKKTDSNDTVVNYGSNGLKKSKTSELLNTIEKCDFVTLSNQIEDRVNTYEGNLKDLDDFNHDAHEKLTEAKMNEVNNYNKGKSAIIDSVSDVNNDSNKAANSKNDAENNDKTKQNSPTSDFVKSVTNSDFVESVKSRTNIDSALTESDRYVSDYLKILLGKRPGHRSRARGRVQRFNSNKPQQQNPDALCGIIFLKEALMAKIMFMIVVEMSRCRPSLSHLSAQYCASRGPSPGKDSQRDGKKQEEVLKKFRMHECNLLLATSALEEGIDLPRCNLVVRWDVPPSYRSHGLCRGRARAPRASVALLACSETNTEALLYNLAVYKELDQIITRKCGCGIQYEPSQEEESHADSVAFVVKPYTPLESTKNNVIPKHENTPTCAKDNTSLKEMSVDWINNYHNKQTVDEIKETEDIGSVDERNKDTKLDNNDVNDKSCSIKPKVVDNSFVVYTSNEITEDFNTVTKPNLYSLSECEKDINTTKSQKEDLTTKDFNTNEIKRDLFIDHETNNTSSHNKCTLSSDEAGISEMDIETNCDKEIINQLTNDISDQSIKTHNDVNKQNIIDENNEKCAIKIQCSKENCDKNTQNCFNNVAIDRNETNGGRINSAKENDRKSKENDDKLDFREHADMNINSSGDNKVKYENIKFEYKPSDSKKTDDNVASVDLNSAIALINRYCGKLPSDTFTRLTPQWWTEEVRLPDRRGDMRTAYICTLRMPLNCPVKYNIVGHPMPTRVLARRMAALQACRILHKSGELDNQLMPIGKENFKAADLESSQGNSSEPPDVSDFARPGTTKRRQYYFKRTAWAFTDCQAVIDTTDAEIENNETPDPNNQDADKGDSHNILYAIVSRLWCALPERYNTRGRRLHAPQHAPQAIGVLMARREPTQLQIPSFPVYTRSGEVRVSVEPALQADVRLSPKRARLIRRFMRFVFTDVLRVRRRGMKLQMEGTTHNNYYIVPTVKRTKDGYSWIDVDWSFLELIYKHTEEQKTIDVEKPLLWEPIEKKKEKPKTGDSTIGKILNPLLKPGEPFMFEPEKYNEAVVTPWYRNRDQPQYFLVAEICWKLSPDSAFPSAQHDSFRSYYRAKYGAELTQRCQPLLDVDHTSARLNLLTPRYVNRKGVALPVSSERTRRAKRDRLDQKQILVPELCRVHPFAAPLWFATVALPCVLYRINALLIADEIRRVVAIDAGLGIPKIDAETCPGFQWPPLDFGWSLAEVLSADSEKAEKRKEEESKQDDKPEESGDKEQKESEEEKEVPKEKTVNEILQEKFDAENGFEIGTWSNDMASSIPEDDEFLEPLPPNLTFCTPSDGANWSDPIEKPKSQFNPSRVYSMADSDCSYTSSDFDSDDSDLSDDSDDEDTTGFTSSKNCNAAMGVRIEYKTAHEAEAVDIERKKPIKPSPQPDKLDDERDVAEYKRTLRAGVPPKQHLDNFRRAVAQHQKDINENGYLISKTKPVDGLLPEPSKDIDRLNSALSRLKISENNKEKNCNNGIIMKVEDLKKEECSKLKSTDVILKNEYSIVDKDNMKSGNIITDNNEVINCDNVPRVENSESLILNVNKAILKSNDVPESIEIKNEKINADEYRLNIDTEEYVSKSKVDPTNNKENIIIPPLTNNNFHNNTDKCVDLTKIRDVAKKEVIEDIFPYKNEIELHNVISLESIEKNKRHLLAELKKSLPEDEIKKLNCFAMKDVDIDGPDYVNEKIANIGFDTKEKYQEKINSWSKPTECKPYYMDGKGLNEKGFDFDYQPDLEGHPGPSPSVILQALTMSNANDGINLERLETIGDSFLKFAITAYLYCAHPAVHEGKLSHMRSKQVSNLNLYRLGRNKRLGARMIASKFEPHDNWLPPCHRPPPTLQPTSAEERMQKPDMPVDSAGCFIPYNLITQHSIPDKSIADCVEALIGAYLLECGPRGALLFMSWLGIRVLPCHALPLPADHPYESSAKPKQSNNVQKPIPKKPVEPISSDSCCSDDEEVDPELGAPEPDWSWPGRPVGSLRPYKDKDGKWMQCIYGELKAPPSPLLRYIEDPEGELEQMLSGYDALENTLQYRFRDRSLLLQALTHASYQKNRLTDCYQRLEFLGDAILDYLITRHLYEDPRRHSPGALTDLRSALVNNTIFATLAARHGFHKYFRHMSPGLNEVLTKYVKIQEENGHSISEEHYLIQEDELEQAEDVEVPKALGDLFESVAGAIFLDSGMSLGAVWRSVGALLGAELDAFSAAAPKSPVRELLEAEPDTAKFGKPERLADGRRVRVCVEVFGRGTFKGIGRNYRIAKGTAARCALRHLRSHRPRGCKQDPKDYDM